MRVRGLLISTAIASSILGAVAAYLVLTVPNDIQAGAILKEARRNIERQRNDEGRKALARVIQQYPRTDAAAAASVALFELQNQERGKLASRVETLQKEHAAQTETVAQLRKTLDELATRAKEPPKTVAPPPAPKTTVSKAAAKKPAKKPIVIRRRRR